MTAGTKPRAKRAAVTEPRRPMDAASWKDFERFGQLLQRPPYRFARTMLDNPHSYTLRRNWASDEDWAWAVTYLRANGYRQRWGKNWYTQIDVNEHFYWTMGYPINWKDGTPCTILINRKKIERPAPYDTIAWGFDDRFRTDEDKRAQQNTFEMIDQLGIGSISNLSVLDVGCGTGTLLRHRAPARYIGIDPCAGMLAELRHRHPHAAAVQTPLERFAPAARVERYDLVLSLFGAGSYLSDHELLRIPLLLRPGGVAVTMFYAPGFTPEQYRSKNAVQAERRSWAPELMPGAVLPSTAPDFVTVITHRDEAR